MNTQLIYGDALYSTSEDKINDGFYQKEQKSTIQKDTNKHEHRTYSELSQSNIKKLDSNSCEKINKFYLNVFNSNLLEKFALKNKPIHQIRGDIKPLGDMEEIFLSKNFSISIKNFTNNQHRNRMNELILTHISKEEFKIIKERAPTPSEEKSKTNPEEEMMIKTLKKTYTSKTLNKIQKSSSKIYKIITDDNSTVKLPSDCNIYYLKCLDITDDVDLKTFCELINEPTIGKWKTVSNDSAIQIYKKSIKNVPQIMIRTIAIIDNYTKDEVFDAISNVNIRKQWDKVFSEFKIVETNDDEHFEVLYMSIKSGFPLVSDRDFVQRRKIWKDFPDENSTILQFKSVDHKNCPVHKNVIRAQTILSGYFIKKISDNPPKTFLSIISQNDVKGKIPTYLVNKVSQTAPKDWVKSLLKGCEIVKKLKNKN